MSLKRILLKPVANFKVNYGLLLPWRWNWSKVKEFLKIFLLTTSLVAVGVIIYFFMTQNNSEEKMTVSDLGDELLYYLYSSGIIPDQKELGNCNVAKIDLRGELVTYIPKDLMDADGNLGEDLSSSEEIVYRIKEAEKNDRFKAILLEVDSYGGSAVAGEEVANALKYASKPTAVLIRDGGVSAAYLAASGANRIFASKYSDIGSIGVTMSYVDNVKKNEDEGLAYVQLSTGKFKDTGDPNRKLTQEEVNLLMRDVNIMQQNFIKKVADNRKMSIEDVIKLADGSSMMGEMALQKGLIDQIGGLFEVKNYLKEKIGAEAEVCP